MNFIEVNGTALRYQRSGSGGTPLVLIHEMGGTLESWDLVVPYFSGACSILRYDTRGAGLSQKVRPPLSIDTMSDDLVALMDAIGLSGKAVLAGVAVGGAIALHTAFRHPERVAAVVASSPAVSIAKDRHAALLTRVEVMEDKGLAAVIDTLDNGYPQELRADAERYAAFRARWLGGDPISYGAIYRMLIATDLQPELPKIACPVLITAGALDRVRPPHLVEPVAKAIPGARYQVLESAHYAPVQTPKLYADAVNAFLRSLGL
jgi:3-oxoadipate enol-lactonase